ncbi:hypothetical protein [Holospora undulata]|uniref:Uncharacterized protein n=1 Tax=Holospora undulata HU1 TaxID=1321371 RepID=A0A061JFX8_9PROT|nr:hypothetical protein [Holospora undulata]ETZ04686.1 hypothetical protein K737_300906 [Holospora undulata HU1]
MKNFFLYLSLLSACAHAGGQSYRVIEESLQKVFSEILDPSSKKIQFPEIDFDQSLTETEKKILKKQVYQTTFNALKLKAYILNLSGMAKDLYSYKLPDFSTKAAMEEFKKFFFNSIENIIKFPEKGDLDFSALEETKIGKIQAEHFLETQGKNALGLGNELSSYIENTCSEVVNSFLSYTEKIKNEIDSAYPLISEDIDKLSKKIERLSTKIGIKESEEKKILAEAHVLKKSNLFRNLIVLEDFSPKQSSTEINILNTQQYPDILNTQQHPEKNILNTQQYPAKKHTFSPNQLPGQVISPSQFLPRPILPGQVISPSHFLPRPILPSKGDNEINLRTEQVPSKKQSFFVPNFSNAPQSSLKGKNLFKTDK